MITVTSYKNIIQIKMENKNRSWDILLISGASGTGKTSIGLLLAQLYGVSLIKVDDFQVFFEAYSSFSDYLTLQKANFHKDYKNIDNTVSPLVNTGKIFVPGLQAVINEHILEGIPMILEGDFILPELSSFFDNNSRIKTILIHESSKDQILQNYLAREGELQEQRASQSFAYGNWLKEEYIKLGIPVIESRPWDTILERVLSIL